MLQHCLAAAPLREERRNSISTRLKSVRVRQLLPPVLQAQVRCGAASGSGRGGIYALAQLTHACLSTSLLGTASRTLAGQLRAAAAAAHCAPLFKAHCSYATLSGWSWDSAGSGTMKFRHASICTNCSRLLCNLVLCDVCSLRPRSRAVVPTWCMPCGGTAASC